MPSTRAAAIAALSTLALSLTACGGSDDTLSKSELTSKGNAICKDIEAKVKGVKTPTDVAGIADYSAKIAPYTAELTSRLKALKPADDVKSDWNTLTSSLAKSSDAFKSIGAQVKAKDQAGLQKASADIDAASKQTTAAAKKLGLSTCN